MSTGIRSLHLGAERGVFSRTQLGAPFPSGKMKKERAPEPETGTAGCRR